MWNLGDQRYKASGREIHVPRWSARLVQNLSQSQFDARALGNEHQALLARQAFDQAIFGRQQCGFQVVGSVLAPLAKAEDTSLHGWKVPVRLLPHRGIPVADRPPSALNAPAVLGLPVAQVSMIVGWWFAVERAPSECVAAQTDPE